MSYIGRGSIAKMLPEFVQKWIHNLQFSPKNPELMEPGPTAIQKVAGNPRVKGFRNPAPGSRPEPVVPNVEHPDDVFNVSKFPRDTTQIPKETFLIVANKYKENPLLAGTTTAIDATPSDEPKGSTGKFGNKAVFEYDPTGLRSSMTATHEAYQASLKKHLPDHLVTYAWEADQEAIIAKYEALGVPCPPGQPFKWKRPKEAKEARW